MAEQKLLGDDRSGLGEDFEHAQSPSDRELGSSFLESNTGPVQTVGDQFADPRSVDRHRLGESFADPNSLDDTKLGESFAETNASGKKRKEPSKPRKPHNYRILALFLVAVVLVFLVIFFVGFLPRHNRDKQNNDRAAQEKNAVPMVEAQKVVRARSGGGLVVPGTTTPLTEAYVYARANGYLKRRLVDIGDRVRKGQLLAVIDAPDLDQQVDQAREQLRQADAQLAQQQTQLALTRITVERYRVLVGKGVFSRQDGDQQETNFRAQEANVAAAQRNVEAFKANLNRVIALQSYERVTAPFDGVVTARNVDVGALISTQGSANGMSAPTSSSMQAGTSSQATANTAGASGSGPTTATPDNAGGNGGPLFTISQVNRLRILISVPEGYAGQVTLGQPAVLHFQEFPNQAFTGQVTRTSASIDQNTRTLLTEVQVDNRSGRLLDGMYAVVTFDAVKGDPPLTISGDAVAVRNDHNVVGLIQNGIVQLRPVELGRDYGPVVEVLGGLKEGDLVASTVTDDVVQGAKVQVHIGKSPGEQDSAPRPPQAAPPGGSTQYGNLSITDANMQGQASGNKSQSGNKGNENGQPPQGKGAGTDGSSKQ